MVSLRLDAQPGLCGLKPTGNQDAGGTAGVGSVGNGASTGVGPGLGIASGCNAFSMSATPEVTVWLPWMNNASLAAGTTALFTLTNSLISANDVLVVSVSGGGTAGAYWPFVSSQTSGSAVIGLYNNTVGALSEAVIINFAIIHGGS